ncbi:MAG: acyltransferase domain-containing protein, partial [bacterium]|nr:acyltransferase domain-containing protein [bacterium]
MTRQYDGSEIAIIGMACRFPGAWSVEEFWRNLCEGVESLTLLSDRDLQRAGVAPAVYRDPDFVRRASVVEDVESFDAEFFGYTPAEARLIDPQQRLFMECAWQALERAGYDSLRHDGAIGVFTGAKTNTYLFNIVGNRELMASMDNFRIAVGNDLASMATQISFRFDLTGPSYALHTACSTSLVAVHLACQSLLLDECRLALAGGAAVNVPQRRGYLYQPGGLLSPDGSCRSFSAGADGTAFGNGAGVVVLKRLEDALADRDPIHAVVLGSATNNDGAKKASYTAPGVDGQTDVILEALACAGVEAESLSFLETHGTGTPLGDSIEILALKQAFGATTSEEGFCALGAVKSNIGHLETAAGVAGLIKTALALKHRMLPPSLHCEQPAAELEGSSFYVNTRLRPWPEDRTPRRAGLSSFGIGSTNVHAILEEPPTLEEDTSSRPWQLLLLSARSAAALDQATANLAAHLREDREEDADEAARLADTAYTLQVGRRYFAHRRAVVCRDLDDAVAALDSLDPERVLTSAEESVNPPVAFLLPGLGDQAVGMARELYRTETTFREWLDRCAELLEPELGLDLREVIYPPEAEGSKGSKGEQGPDLRRLLGRGGATSDAERRLARTEVAQPAMFAVEYALAQLWMEWGVRPRAMIGFSLGEYVAACLAGVFSLEDALKLVARRARMIGELPAGAMLGVSLPAAELEATIAELGAELSLAASNGPSLSVASGDPEAVAELERVLEEREVACRRLATTHAFHSRSLDPLADELTAVVKDLSLRSPTMDYLSNLTGTWITPEEAVDPTYWARHMCQPVRFEEGVRELLADERRVLLELGSGQSLSSFVKVHPDCKPERTVVTALPGAFERRDDAAFALATLGRLWQAGVEVDWSGFYAREQRRRRILPTYPFERKYYWVDPDRITESLAASSEVRVTLDKQEDLADWLYRPVWEAVPRPEAAAADDGCWLVLGDSEGPSGALAEALRQAGRDVVEAAWADGFHASGDGSGSCSYILAPDRPEDYVALFETLRAQGRAIRCVVHLAGLSPPPEGDAFAESWSRGFLSLLFLAQAVGRLGLADPGRPLAVTVATTGGFRVTGEETLRPESALAVGPCKVIPQEFPGLSCRQVDVFPCDSQPEVTALLVDELTCDDGEELVAYRQGERLIRRFERLPVAETAETEEAPRFKERGTYLLTGGLGGLGLALSEHLARRYQARLALIDRSPLPEPDARTAWLEEHDDDDPTSVKIRKIRSLEQQGAEVL